MKMSLSKGVLMEHPVFCSISTDSFFLLHIHRALKRCTMWFFLFPCNKWKHSPEKVYPKGYEQGGNKPRVNAGVISNVDFGLCIWGTFFSSSHALFLLYHMQFCFHIFVCIHSLATSTTAVKSTWQDWLLCHLMLLFIYRPHLLIYSPSLGCLLFSSFSLWDWWELLLQACHLWNDRGDPEGGAGPVCFKYIYISIFI